MTDYRGFRIKEVHAIVGIDDDDEEAIPAITVDGMHMPLVASDRVRLELLCVAAQKIANETGKSFKIVKFTVREDIGEIVSKKVN
jgi:hypothetical protein